MGKVGCSKASSSRMFLWSWITPPVTCCLRGLWQVRRTLVAATAVYALVLLIVLPFKCTNLPHCKLYRNRLHDFDTAIYYNSLRVKRAKEFLSKLDKGKTKQLYLQHKTKCCPRFAIGVITTRRETSRAKSPQPQYLTQVMAQLHKALVFGNATSSATVFMCNVDQYPKGHTEFQNLTAYFPYRIKHDRRSHLQFLDQYEKEKLDYKFCLREALNFLPEYVVLIEDDAYPHTEFYSVMDHVVRTKLETKIRAGELVRNDEEWMLLKLNFPDSLSFFERNWYFALEWVALSLTVSGTFTLGCHLAHLWGGSVPSERDATQHQSWLYLIFILCFGLVFICLVTLERPHFTALRGYSKHLYTLGPGTSCCTPAVLYPAGQVPFIIGYLQQIHCSSRLPLDFALEDYRLRRGFRQYLISPNLFRHIGMFSSLRNSYNKKGASKYLFEE
ncbi:hypothetical protein HOLleu_36816 [Holothuria leucospilota]|uniref:Transmembrane protein 246-like n=1 Tax=Holothuria leucospilota TaxID=206669 RepID=A0A9Q0YP70_HOLLE|nr:hypothetical protein HOLleu_36816 [Holothuria leucospilota]